MAYEKLRQGARGWRRDGSFLIVDRAGRVDFVVGVRSHTGEVLGVYLMDRDIKKLMESLSQKGD
jgi:hypothetical protein